MSEIGHAVSHTIGVIQSVTSTTYSKPGSTGEHEIQGSELDASSEYILIARANHNGSATASNEHYMQVAETSVGALAQSEQRIEPRRSRNKTGHPFGWIGTVTTAASPNSYQIQCKSDGTVSSKISASYLMMLKLDDLSTSDYKYAADDTGDTSLTTSIEDGVSVSLGAGDWLIFAFGRFDSNSTSDDVILQIDIDGTTYGKSVYEMEDTAENHCRLTSTAINVASSSTAKVQYGTAAGTSPDLLSTRIFALRLDAFEDHAFTANTTSLDITSQGTDFTTATLTHTSSTSATRDWAVVAQATHDVGNDQTQLMTAIDQGGSQIIGGTSSSLATNVASATISHGSTDEVANLLFGEETSHPDATDLDFDLVVMDYDSPGNGDIIESMVAAFTWEMAAVPVTLVVAEALLSMAAEAPALTQAHTLAIEETTQSVTADSAALTQAHTLAVAEALHSVLADSPALTQAHTLVVAECLQTVLAGNVDLTQANTIAVADALLSIAADSVDLVQAATLVVAECLQSVTADNVDLSQANTLAVAGALQSMAADGVALTQASTLAVLDALMSVAADSVTLSASITLSVNEALHAIAADSPTLSQAHTLVVAEAFQAIAAESPALTQANTLAIADALLSILAESPALTQAHSLAIEDVLQSTAADSPTLTQSYALTVQEALQAIAAESPALTQASTLADVANTLQSVAADSVALTQANTLAISDTLQAIEVDTPTLSEAATLAVQETLQSIGVDAPALTQANILAVADAALAISAANVDLTQSSTLIVSDALFAMLADSVDLIVPPDGLGRELYFVIQARSRSFVIAPRDRELFAGNKKRSFVVDPRDRDKLIDLNLRDFEVGND